MIHIGGINIKKTMLLLIILYLLTSSIPVVIGDSPPTTIYLVTDSDTYKKFGFDDLGVYYTPESLTSFHMPFIVPKKGNMLKKNDLKGSITDSSENWNKKNPKFNYDIIGSNNDYYVVDYSMQLKASTDSFTVDFIPEIKSKKFTEFAYWNSSWDKRGQVHINSSQVDNDLVNFPVLLNFTNNASFYNYCQSDLDDIRFVSSDNTTEFYHEIEDYSFNDYGDTVNLSVWVNVTGLSSSSDTYINVYYHNFNANEQGMNTSVWDSDYEVVYHMYNNSYTSVDNMRDSTVNGNYGDTYGDGPHHIAGDSSPAVDFTSDSIRTSSSVFSGSAVDMTVECYFKADEVPTAGLGDILVGNDETGGSYTFILTLEDSKVKFNYRDGGDNFASTSFGFTDTSGYHYLAGVCDESVGTEIYLDGDFKNSQGYASFKSYSPVWSVGSRGALDRYYNGKFDELRISSTVRNNSWLNTSYNNLNNMTSGEFYFISSSVEEGPSSPPVDIYANTTSDTSINLSWDKGTGVDYTYIERNTVDDWDRTEGTDIYKNTGTSFTDTVSKGSLYYYKFWGYNNTSDTYSNPSSVVSNLTGPSDPSNVDGSLDGTVMNITWTVASFGADSTVVISKLNSHPTGPSDGTEEYNGTSDGVNISGQTTSHYYSVFSFNETVNRYSSGIDFNYGSLTVNVYNESDGNALSNWGFFIKNNDGTSTYQNTSCNNSLILSTDQLPTGDDCSITINLTGYDTRIYYIDIAINSHYTLNAFLNQNTTTENYVFRIINEYDESVEGALIEIRRVVNGSYENISKPITDGNGYCTVNLVEEANYLCIINADNYLTSYKDFYALPIEYEADRYHTFKILHTDTDYNDSVIWDQIITFNGYMQNTDFYVNYTDSNSDTTSTRIILYEITDSGRNPVGWDNRTGENSFVTTFTALNSSNCHQASITVVHGFFGTKTNSFTDCTNIIQLTSDTDFDNIFDNVFKNIPFGWSNFVGMILLIFLLFAFDYRNAGIALILTGFVMSGLNYVVGLSLIGLSIPIVFIILGIVAQWNTHRREMGT